MTIEIVGEFSCDVQLKEKSMLSKQMEAKLLPGLISAVPSHLSKASQLIAHQNQGGSGHVFDIFNPCGGRLIIKLECETVGAASDAVLERFKKELWISKQDWNLVRLPKLLAVGHADIVDNTKAARSAFILQEYSPYPPAHECINNQEEINKLFIDIGKIAREIHAMPTTGFGDVYMSDEERFSLSSWGDYIDAITENSSFIKALSAVPLSQGRMKNLLDRINRLRNRSVAPRLFHGDLIVNWGNLLVDPNTKEIKAIIDWERSGSGDPLIIDVGMALCTLHERMKEKESIEKFLSGFLSGYGLGEIEYTLNYKSDVETFAAICAINKFSSSTQIERKQRLIEFFCLLG